MARYTLPISDGTFLASTLASDGVKNTNFNHQVNFKVVDGGTPTGTITVSAIARDSDTVQPIPDGEIDLLNPESLVYQFTTDDYQFVISGSNGTGYILISDDSFGVG